jgi:hypothetical protein
MKNFIDPCNASGPIYLPRLILHVLPPADPTAQYLRTRSYHFFRGRSAPITPSNNGNLVRLVARLRFELNTSQI